MPPSYSMMLPGRMSTPLIFMSSLGESVGKEPARLLAAHPFRGKKRIGIDRGSIPPALARCHRVDRKMEMRSRRARVSSMAHKGDDLAALYQLTLGKAWRIGRQMGVIVDPLLVGRAFVDREPAAHAVEEL